MILSKHMAKEVIMEKLLPSLRQAGCVDVEFRIVNEEDRLVIGKKSK